MKTKLFNQKGKEVGDVTVSDIVFKTQVKQSVLAEYIFAFQSNQRQANAHAKDRSEVSGTRSKPWRQKGTGRARVGTKQNPIWRGGGAAFGPRNTRNWKKNLNRKFKKAALRQALSSVMQEKNVKIIDSASFDNKKPLTKQALAMNKSFGDPKKMTLVTNEVKTNIVNGMNNVSNMRVVYVRDLNAYDVLNAGVLLIEDEARKYLESTLVTKK